MRIMRILLMLHADEVYNENVGNSMKKGDFLKKKYFCLYFDFSLKSGIVTYFRSSA